MQRQGAMPEMQGINTLHAATMEATRISLTMPLWWDIEGGDTDG